MSKPAANMRIVQRKALGLFLRSQRGWNYIKEDGRNLGVGQVSSDARPHGPSAKHCDFADVVQWNPQE